MRRLINKQTKKGNVALETVIAGGALFMVFMLIIGYFTYLYPRYMVDLEVQNLSHAIKMDGKLTMSDFEVFIANMEDRGYTEEAVRAGTVVVAQKIDETELKPGQAKNTETLIDTESYTANIVERNNGQIIVQVNVPANNAFLNGALRWFGGDSKNDMSMYTVKRTVMSEAYLPYLGD